MFGAFGSVLAHNFHNIAQRLQRCLFAMQQLKRLSVVYAYTYF